MIRCPLIFTLFPYTTLFRSQFELEYDVCRAIDRKVAGGVNPRSLHNRAPGDRVAGRICLETRRPAGERLRHARDRKSTRLNSSHLGISYAVFCLKKKTNKE